MDQLPEEIVLKVFEYISFEDLQSSSLVCKKWNVIIGNNPSTMKHLPLVLSSMSDEITLEALELKRKYIKIKIFNIDNDLEKNTIRVIEKHGSAVRQLHISKCLIPAGVQIKDFVSIMESLPLLEKISFDGIDVESNINPLPCVKLEHLKEIVLRSSGTHLLNVIDTPKVKILKKQCSYEEILQVKHCPKLEELAIGGQNILPAYEEFNYPLKKLSLFVALTDDSFLPWLEALKNSLVELEIGRRIPLATFEFVFRHLDKLQLLKLNSELLPLNDESNRKLIPNPSVKTLILQAKRGWFSAYQVEPFIGNLPNVETLVLNFELSESNSIRCITFVSLNLTKLHLLEVSSLHSKAFENVSIPTLLEFHIHRYGCENEFTNDGLSPFTISCPNIEKLTIEVVWDSFQLSANELLIIASNLKKLQSLYIGDGFIGSREGFDHLLSCPELKRVTIMKTAISSDPTMSDNFTQHGPYLILLENPAQNIRVDFNLWQDEDVLFDYVDSEIDENDDIDSFADMDNDEIDDFYDVDDWYDGGYDDDDNSEEEFPGAFRPG